MFTIDDGLAHLDPATVLGNLPITRELAVSAKEAGARALLLDLGGQTMINSTQIGFLFGLARCCDQESMRLMVYGANPDIARSLSWVNAHRVMDLFPDRTTAICAAG